MYYRECPDCHAHLDPGEQCDCKKEKQKKEEIFKRMFRVDETNQLQMNLEEMHEQAGA